jgi:hypothetical protein
LEVSVPQFDLPQSELERYRPDLAEPEDFDQFWVKSVGIRSSAGRTCPSALRACRLPSWSISDTAAAVTCCTSDAVGRGRVRALRHGLRGHPFLCDFPRATTITNAHPYNEVRTYLTRHRGDVDTPARTLSFLDGRLHARRASFVLRDAGGRGMPALDDLRRVQQLCRRRQQIHGYPFNGHEGGAGTHDRVKLQRLRRHTRRAEPVRVNLSDGFIRTL